MSKNKPPRTHGGKRKNAGRPPDWLKAKCANLVDKNKLIEFIVRVANGDETEPQIVRSGGDVSVEECAPSIKDRLRAVEMLLDRGFGRPTEHVEVTDVTDRAAILRERREKLKHS